MVKIGEIHEEDNKETPFRRLNPQKPRFEQSDESDKLSTLHPHLIHEIFKFLDVKEAIMTALLSKKWKQLWLSCPYLNFSFPNHRFDKPSDARFRKFVDTTLSVCHGNPIQNFSLQYTLECKAHVVRSWLKRVVGPNLQVLNLSSLRINEQYVDTLCKHTKHLTFDEVGFLGPIESERLSFICPLMETLKFVECYHVKNYGKFGGEDTYNELRIDAPKLKTLYISVMTTLSKRYTCEKLHSLVTATIDIYGHGERQLTPMFRGLVHAKSLELTADTLQVLPDVPIMLDGVEFQHLRYLKVTGWMITGCGIPSLVKVLEKSPHLQTLVLRGPNPLEPEIDEEALGVELLSWCTNSNLQNMELQCYELSENAYKLLKFMLENTPSLRDFLLATNW